MRAVVTAVAGFRGTLACEYEIRADDGSVLAFDYVLIRPQPEVRDALGNVISPAETWTDMRGFLTNWLAHRAAKWDVSREGRKETRLGGRRLASVTREAPPIEVGALPTADTKPGGRRAN